MLKKLQKVLWENKWGVFVIIVGTIAWSETMVRSGIVRNYGIGYWGANGHDGIWHLALIKSLARHPTTASQLDGLRNIFSMPVFGGVALQNYHIGFDLLVTLVNRTTGISVNVLYFQIFPVLISVGVGILIYKFVEGWTKKKSAAIWSLFFTYFGGSMGWIVGGGESTFWSQQAISTLINPPYAFSLMLLFMGLIILVDYVKKPKLITKLFLVLIFGTLIQVKAYAGLLGLAGIGASGLLRAIKTKKIDLLIIGLLAGIITVLLYLPLNSISNGVMVWKPFWFLETMMQLTDRLGWVRFGEAMVNYKYGNIWWKMIPAYGVAFIVFWYGNFWTRAIGEIGIAKLIIKRNKITEIELFILSVIGFGILIPMMFVQKGTAWNTIQFFYYSQVFMGVIAGVSFVGILQKYKNKYLKNFMIGMVVVLTVPTTFISLKQVYLTESPPAILPSDEVDALKFLSSQPEGVVLTYPFDEELSRKANENPPRPLYLYVSNAYVSAYSNKPVYLEDEVNLDITGYDWKSRREDVEEFYNSLDHEAVYNFLRDKKIKYVYWVKPQRAKLGETQLGLTRIFENESVDIYEVE